MYSKHYPIKMTLFGSFVLPRLFCERSPGNIFWIYEKIHRNKVCCCTLTSFWNTTPRKQCNPPLLTLFCCPCPDRQQAKASNPWVLLWRAPCRPSSHAIVRNCHWRRYRLIGILSIFCPGWWTSSKSRTGWSKLYGKSSMLMHRVLLSKQRPSKCGLLSYYP